MLNFTPSSHDVSVRLLIGKQSTLDILTKFRIDNGFYRYWRVEKAKEEHWSNTDNNYRKQQPPVGLGDQGRAWSRFGAQSLWRRLLPRCCWYFCECHKTLVAVAGIEGLCCSYTDWEKQVSPSSALIGSMRKLVGKLVGVREKWFLDFYF